MSYDGKYVWNPGDPITSARLTNIEEDILSIKIPPKGRYWTAATNGAVQTTSTSFTDVAGASLTISTTGGAAMIGAFGGWGVQNGGTVLYLDAVVDGVRQGESTNGLQATIGTLGYAGGGNPQYPFAFLYVTTELASGSHTFKLQWKISSSTAVLYQLHFWVAERL